MCHKQIDEEVVERKERSGAAKLQSVLGSPSHLLPQLEHLAFWAQSFEQASTSKLIDSSKVSNMEQQFIQIHFSDIKNHAPQMKISATQHKSNEKA